MCVVVVLEGQIDGGAWSHVKETNESEERLREVWCR